MNHHLASSIHTSRSGRIPRRVGKAFLTLPIIVLACASCQDQGGAGMVDTEPLGLGLGLRVIGYSIVAAAVLGVLSKLVVKP